MQSLNLGGVPDTQALQAGQCCHGSHHGMEDCPVRGGTPQFLLEERVAKLVFYCLKLCSVSDKEGGYLRTSFLLAVVTEAHVL